VLAGDFGGDFDGVPDAVKDGETGYVVNGRDLAAIADRLARLLLDRDLAARMAAAGPACAEERCAGTPRPIV
jgi:phosphatidylinositol alpha-1,6-mannosyltransferase